MKLVEIHDFRLAFEGFDGITKVLDGIDLALDEGESVGIVGETGCGKSVLAKSILRLLDSPPARIVSGGIRFAGTELTTLDDRRMRQLRGSAIAMVFQDPMTYLNPVFSIGRQMTDVIRAHRRVGKAAARDRAIELLAQVRLPEPARLLAAYPHQLSGGMRQRVLIAMALSGNPRLLIADEPTTALDATVQAQVLRLIGELAASQSLTLIMISHDLGVIAATCRRVAVVYAGTIVEDAPAGLLFSAPAHPYTAGLLRALPDLAGDTVFSGIPGAIPNLLDPPQGCRFHPRCPLAQARCRCEKPLLRPLADGRRVACHLLAQ
jgi:oligopeptide/dipeptide ABC transporter ATP-binding protein